MRLRWRRCCDTPRWPQVLRSPATLKLSFTVIGTPNNGVGAAVTALLVQRAGTVARTIEITHHHGIDAVIEPLDPRNIMVE